MQLTDKKTRRGLHTLHTVLSLVLLSCAAHSSWAQSAQSDQINQSNEPLKQLSLEQLGNVEVTTVTKEPEEVWNTPAAIYVITQDDIRRSGARSIPEALRLAPGVEVARIDSSRWSIGIRGFGTRLTRDVLVLIDGRIVYTSLFAGTYWEVQNVMMEDIDRIEVIRGPGGTVWGPNAVDGVINIITKSSKDTHGTLLSTGGGDVEQGFLDAHYGGTNGKNLDYRVYAMAFNRGPEYHTDGDNFDRWRNLQSGFRVDWARNNRDSFTFQGDLYDQINGEFVNATTYAPPYSVNLAGNAYLSGGNIMGTWRRVIGDGNDVQIQAYYDSTNRHELNLGDIRNTFAADYQERHPLPGRQELTWGAGVYITRAHELEVVSGLQFIPPYRTDQLYTGFLQDEISLIPRRLTLTLGSKFLQTNYTHLEAEPTIRLLWAPTPTQSLWAAFTHAVRTPSDSERDFYLLGLAGFTPSGLPYLARFNANPNFNSEQLNGYELGYRRLLGSKVYVDIASFYNHYNGLFSEDIIGEPFFEATPPPPHLLLPAEFGNGLRGITKGVEVTPEWKPVNFWRLSGSYSFLHMDLERTPGSLDVGTAPIIEGSSPQHQVAAQSYLDLPRAVSLDVEYRYVSSLPAQLVPAYSTANARIAWRPNPHVELSMNGENLFQPHHAEDGGDPGPLVLIKRSAYGEITFTR